MAIIGTTGKAANYIRDASTTYAHGSSSEHYITGTQPEEVISFHIYRNANTAGDNKIAELAIFDISGGVEGSVQVGNTTTINAGTGDYDTWIVANIAAGSRPQLAPNTTYNIQVWSDGWRGRVKGSWDPAGSSRQQAIGNLQTTFVSNASIHDNAVSNYATTEIVGSFLISDVNGGNTIVDGQTNVVATGTGFDVSGSKLYLSAINDFSSPDKQLQTLVGQSDTSMTFNASYPVDATATAYVFIEKSDLQVTAGFPVELNIATSVQYSAEIRDLEGTLVICSSSDFAAGMVAYVNQGAGNEQIATAFSAETTINTSRPVYNVSFDTPPVKGTDTITLIYTKANGDIMSAPAEGSGMSPASLEDTVLIGTVC